MLATFRGGTVTVSDLDAQVRALPEAHRIAPEGTSLETWLEELVRALALDRLLAQSDAVRERLASSETTVRRRWMIAGLLATAVIRELAEDARPNDRAVRQRMGTIADSRPQPLYNFRHVFLRLDGAADAEERSVRRLAASIRRRARQGEDFADLARKYSQSSTAAAGGLAEHQRPARLEATARQAIERLAEGEVSPVVENRTGLHIFRLERKLTPRPPSPEQHEQQVLRILASEAVAAARANLLTQLRQRFEVATNGFPWRVGSFEISQADLGWMVAAARIGENPHELVVDRLLLAEEGRQRGLRTPELEAQVDRQLRAAAIRAAYQEHRAAWVAAIPQERLRSIYEARPGAFAESLTAQLDLIFVPQGRDVFATQRDVEHHVASLRAGASFSELARRISTGPGAAQGGDLGLLSPHDWARLGPEIYKTVVAMEAGAIAGPVYQTDRLLTTDPRTLRGGFAILRVRAKNPPRERTFEQAADGLRAAWARQNTAELDTELRASTLASAGFEIVRLPALGEFLR